MYALFTNVATAVLLLIILDVVVALSYWTGHEPDEILQFVPERFMMI